MDSFPLPYINKNNLKIGRVDVINLNQNVRSRAWI